MERLIPADPKNAERIFPYLGGEEINNSPRYVHHRYVVNFEDFPLRRAELGLPWVCADEETKRDWLRAGVVPMDYPEPVAEDWPNLIDIVRLRVKPERDIQNRDSLRERWWQYAEKRPGLMAALAEVASVLVVNCGATPHLALARVSTKQVFAHSLVVFPISTTPPFTVLQSRVHEVWARFMASSMKDDLRYTPTDCFETFPFPANYEESEKLAAVGETYYNSRAELMIRTDRGLTKTYNRFHDPEDQDPDIQKLRELHAAMDSAVLEAYGWQDLDAPCVFESEFDDEDEDDDDDGARKRKKKKFRLRWETDVRDKLLARLLDLNRQRALMQETEEPPPKAKAGKKSKRQQPENQEFPF